MRNVLLLVIICIALGSAQTGARYLIITHDDYYFAIQPLAQWKTQKGMKSKVVRLSEIGNDSTQIRNYVVTAYNTWDIRPEYLLLVGNDTQIRQVRYQLPESDVFTDNYYVNVNGDFKNEILPGRLWVYDTTNVKTIVSKILNYEKQPWLQDTLWYRRGVTIVNEDEDSVPADSVYWSDARYAHQLMSSAGFTHIDSFAQSFGHDSTDVIAAFNQGCLYMMYRGVGFFIWDWPFMGLWVNLLNNGFKMPIVISATCATVEGIGYTWLNLGTPEQPRGTVGFFGTTTALYHAAEYRSALARGTLHGIFDDTQCTMGKAAEYGRQYFTEIFHDSLEYFSWTCLGDPDMRLWTTTPQPVTVIHDSIFWTGNIADTINIEVRNGIQGISEALVCVMAQNDSTLYHTGYTDADGRISFIDTITIPGDSLCFTVTGRNLRPYQQKTPVFVSGAPFVLLSSYEIDDSTNGNNNHLANPGEDIEIPVWLKNWGDSTAYDVSGTLHTLGVDTFVTLYDTVKYFFDIAGLDSAYTTANGYNLMINASCPDTHTVELHLDVVDADSNSWVSSILLTVYAPLIVYSSYHFSGTYKYSPLGDTSTLIVTVQNRGSFFANDVSATLFSNDTDLVIVDAQAMFGDIAPGGYGTNQSDPFAVSVKQTAVPGNEIEVFCEVVSGVYKDTITFTIYGGQRDYYVWDMDNNHSSGPYIDTILASMMFRGDYCADSLPLNDYLSIYKSLFVCLGVYPNNHIVTDSSDEGPAIFRFIQTFDGNVYMEGGDVWYADPYYYHGYFFHPIFEIYPFTNSVGPLPHISGTDSTFTRTMFFVYGGESNSIDRIAPQGMGNQIFLKTSNSMGIGVAAYHRTVGISFELGGLVDSLPPSTKTVLLDSIMRYFGISPTGLQGYENNTISLDLGLIVHPNPCRGTVRFLYSGGRISEDVIIHIYDITGRLVNSLELPSVINQQQSAIWDATDLMGRLVPQGIYFLQATDGTGSLTRKVILLH